MNKLLATLLAGVFAATLSIGAFAADEAPAAPAKPAVKKHKAHKHAAKPKADAPAEAPAK